MTNPTLACDRRGFLRLGLGTVGGALSFALPASAVERRPRSRAEEGGGTLVLVQLAGGNDGLSTLVPFADDDYHRLRPSIGLGPGEVLRLDERRGLHPALQRLRERFDAGQLAIVEGVGYPQPNRSHFRSLEVWHAADARGRRVESGWVGRLAERAFPDADPLRVVHVGSSVPFSLASATRPPLGFVSPLAFRRLGFDDEKTMALRADEAGASAALEHVRRVAEDAQACSARLQAAVQAYQPRAAYAQDPFSAGLRTIAAILSARIGTRILSIELSGFDTHNDQRRRHDRQMEELDRGLGAFLEDLAASEAGRGTLVCAFSEFGRRVAENGSRGTDHGTAGPVLVAGARVKGGFWGRTPALSALEDGDLVHTTDFRSVYATLIQALFDVSPERVLGQSHPILGFA